MEKQQELQFAFLLLLDHKQLAENQNHDINRLLGNVSNKSIV